MSIEVGSIFQNQTKYVKGNIGNFLDWTSKPEKYKKYPDANIIKLSNQLPIKNLTLTEILKKRRSTRSFSSEPISLLDLSFLLWASTGVQRQEHGHQFRTAPSAGALYPIETYIVINSSEELKKGLYHYHIQEHALEELKLGSFNGFLCESALEQEMVANAPVVFVWTAIFERSAWKYKQRGYRYVYMDAGIVGENLMLAATGIGLGSCHVGAFYDDEINQFLGVDGTEESTILLSVVGHLNCAN